MSIEVHAKLDGKDFPSKKALKEAMKASPSKVTFTTVSPFNGDHTWRGDALPEGEILQPTGPDPQVSRKWYATVQLKKGNAVVS